MARFADLVSGPKTATAATPDNGTATAAADLEALKSETRRNRNKLAKSGRTVQQGADALENQADLDALFANENWEEIASLYFEGRYAMTGWDGFRLNDKQKRILGSTMGAAMRVLLRIDPAYVALLVFGTNFGAFIVDKEVRYRHLVKAEQARRTGERAP